MAQRGREQEEWGEGVRVWLRIIRETDNQMLVKVPALGTESTFQSVGIYIGDLQKLLLICVQMCF